MKTLKTISLEGRLKNLFDKYKALPEDADEIRAHWCRYLCVLVFGYIEVGTKEIYISYSRKKCNPSVASYVSSSIRYFRNPTMDEIIRITGYFNKTWAQNLEDKTNGEIKEAINSVVSNRHIIAHGGNTTISFVRIEPWYKKSLELIEIMIKIFGL